MPFALGMKPYAARALAAALLVAALAIPAAPAQEGRAPKGMLLVLPAQDLPLIQQLNPATRFDVLRLSQLPGVTVAVADAVRQEEPAPRGGPFPLLLLARQLPELQQLNQGASIEVRSLFEMTIGSAVAPVARVEITQTNDSLHRISPLDFLLVLPRESLPAMAQLNAATRFDVVRILQTGDGPASQALLVAVQQKSGIHSLSQPFPLLVLASDLPALQRLNVGVEIRIVGRLQAMLADTGEVVPIAHVNLTQKSDDLGGGSQPG